MVKINQAPLFDQNNCTVFTMSVLHPLVIAVSIAGACWLASAVAYTERERLLPLVAEWACTVWAENLLALG